MCMPVMPGIPMVFEDDLKEIKSMQSEIWKSMNKILKRLGQVQ